MIRNSFEDSHYISLHAPVGEALIFRGRDFVHRRPCCLGKNQRALVFFAAEWKGCVGWIIILFLKSNSNWWLVIVFGRNIIRLMMVVIRIPWMTSKTSFVMVWWIANSRARCWRQNKIPSSQLAKRQTISMWPQPRYVVKDICFFLCEVTNYVSQEHQKGFQPQEEHEKKTSQVGCFLLFLPQPPPPQKKKKKQTNKKHVMSDVVDFRFLDHLF